MNRESVLFNLREAHEELSKLIEDMESDPDYTSAEFLVAMSHVYHHLNTAWHTQDENIEATRECMQEDFDRWRLMPSSEELLLVED